MEKLTKENALLDPLVNRVEAKIEAAGRQIAGKVETAVVAVKADLQHLYLAGAVTGFLPGLLCGLLIAAIFGRK